MSPTGQDLLRAYDEQLRTDAETPSAIRVERLGPLRLVTFAGGEGFVTYRDLGGADQPTIRSWVEQALARYRRDGAWRVEWKTRGHDRAPGLNEALLDHGFVAAEQEAIMIGPARALAIEVPLPAGIVVERASTSTQIQAALIAQDEIFGEPLPPAAHERLLERALAGDGVEIWLARAGDTVVSAGRLEPVAGTDFAGIWGGATRPEWRHQGIYRALTAARASSALAGGKTLIHSDSTPFSQPILERAGLVAVSTTTPYFWRP